MSNCFTDTDFSQDQLKQKFVNLFASGEHLKIELHSVSASVGGKIYNIHPTLDPITKEVIYEATYGATKAKNHRTIQLNSNKMYDTVLAKIAKKPPYKIKLIEIMSLNATKTTVPNKKVTLSDYDKAKPLDSLSKLLG